MAATGIRVVPADEPVQPSAGHDAAPDSVLAQLRAAAAAQQVVRELELAVGGAFGDKLAIVYGALPPAELQRYVQLASAGELRLAIDMAVASCKRIIWRADGHKTDLNVGLDSRLWAMLGWPLPEHVSDVDELTSTEVVYTLFGNDGFALARHLEQLSTWMQDPLGGDAPGEASPAT
jgi:hypothetical protein